MTTFLRLVEVEVERKQAALGALISHLASESLGNAESLALYDRSPADFSSIPGAPVAYWASSRILELFAELQTSDSIQIVSTNPLNADFRYARNWWEVSKARLGLEWRPWAKGGRYSPFYYDIDTVIAWNQDRMTYTGFLGTKNRPLERPASSQYFFSPGLTWPRRTQSGLGVRTLPAGSIFADKGPAVFVVGGDSEDLLALLAVMTSSPFRYLVALQMAFGSYEVGVIQRTPLPELREPHRARLASLAHRAWTVKWRLDSLNETSHAFVGPKGLPSRLGQFQDVAERDLQVIQEEIDSYSFDLYGITSDERAEIYSFLTRETSLLGASDEEHQEGESDGGVDDAAGDDAHSAESNDAVLSWLVGVAFGRFDLRLATRERALPPEPGPFDPLPTSSPGMPSDSDVRASSSPDILVCDSGHARDLAAMVSTLADMAGVAIPDPGDLQRWLTRELFPLHIRMYSKSRRKAPIYWQLATGSASYSVWLYVHAFTADTMFRVQNEYVAPKLLLEEQRLGQLRTDAGARASAAQRKLIAEKETFVDELRDLFDEVRRVAPLWNPNLDDGVVINFAPLWRLVPHHKPWQKELKATWDALCDGKYDWAHLAMHLWPERVVPKCAADRSLAIAHGLEDVFWEQDRFGKWHPRKQPTRDIDDLVRERTSSAVNAALHDLVNAPTPTGQGRGRRRASSPGRGGR